MSAAHRMEEIMTRPKLLTEPPAPSGDQPLQEERPRLKLPEAIQAAAEKKMLAELEPIADKLTRLRATLDAYEVRVREDVERRVSNAILAVLDMQQADGDDTYAIASKDLREAIVPVAEMVGLPFVFEIKDSPPEPPAPPKDEAPSAPPPPVASASSAEQPETQRPEKSETTEPAAADSAPHVVSKESVVPAPSSTAPVSHPAPAPVSRLRTVTSEHIATGKRLIAEVEALRHGVKEQHPTRLFPLIQAIAAEVRMLQERLPMGHDLTDRLGRTLGALNGIRIEGGVEEYVTGLGFNSRGNWEHLSFANRKLVAKYDRDTAEGPPSTKTPKPKPQKADEPETNGQQHQWPSLPRLRAMTKPILLAGGIRVPEKLKSIQERFGFTVEWHEIDHDNPRASQSLLAKVRAGKVGVVVFLEGVMRHGTWKPTSEACNLLGIPYAMADKAGTASLQQAFDELERKLSTT